MIRGNKSANKNIFFLIEYGNAELHFISRVRNSILLLLNVCGISHLSFFFLNKTKQNK